MKKLPVFLLVIGMVLTGVVPVYSTGCTNKTEAAYSAELSGANENPPVTTPMTGRLDITFNANRTEAKYKLTINSGTGVISSELHMGAPNISGPREAILFEQPAGVDINGILIEATLNDASFLGQLATLPALESAIKQGNIYCNVHTLANPNGAMRGQVR